MLDCLLLLILAFVIMAFIIIGMPLLLYRWMTKPRNRNNRAKRDSISSDGWFDSDGGDGGD